MEKGVLACLTGALSVDERQMGSKDILISLTARHVVLPSREFEVRCRTLENLERAQQVLIDRHDCSRIL